MVICAVVLLSGCAAMERLGACSKAGGELLSAWHTDAVAQQGFNLWRREASQTLLTSARRAHVEACGGRVSRWRKVRLCMRARAWREGLYYGAGYSHKSIGYRDLVAGDRMEWAACNTARGLH